MKEYIENRIRWYEMTPKSVVEHMFCTLGNGVDLNNKGYLPENYKGQEIYDFPEPEPFPVLYPWDDSECFQPFRKLAGCRDVGFKETAEYFLKCLELTPESISGAKEWKDNIETIREVLLDTPTIKDEFKITDMDKFLEKVANDKFTNQHGSPDVTKEASSNSVYKHWFFDVQWSDCPECVEEEVKHSWREYELGNDNYLWKATLDEDLFDRYPHIYFWLKHKGVGEDEEVIVHWWW